MGIDRGVLGSFFMFYLKGLLLCCCKFGFMLGLMIILDFVLSCVSIMRIVVG